MLICDNDVVKISQDINELEKHDEFISFGVYSISNYFLGKKIRLPNFIDIQTAVKLLVGKPKSFFKQNQHPWNLLNIIAKHLNKDSIKLINQLHRLKINPKEFYAELNTRKEDIMNGFSTSCQKILADLKKQNELARFLDLENPLYNIFLISHFRGIEISDKELINRLNDLLDEVYSSYKHLEFKYNFRSQKIKSNISWNDIKNNCKLDYISEDLTYNFWKSAELYAEQDDFLFHLVRAYKSNIDYSALIKYTFDNYKRIYPFFDIMGTVTGRILIKSPGIQYLKKTSRTIFKPKEGFVFLYADFDQFEPGIVASFSKDEILLELYNKGDVYNELSNLLFSSTSKRHIAKIIFLSFLYGMQKKRLSNFLTDLAGEEASKKGLEFFDKFQRLSQWKQELYDNALKLGYSSSVNGNRRYISNNEKLTDKEKRWIPNQVIQGTSSYIFKKSLLALSTKANYVSLLIPMHDGILMEIQKEKVNEAKKIIIEIFNDEFRTVCPDINTSVSFENFSD
jgi:DNA polymerase I-like protein with 3'-5' exonuclease and polymerase domains